MTRRHNVLVGNEGKCALDRDLITTERIFNGLFTIFDAKHLLPWLLSIRSTHATFFRISNVKNTIFSLKIRFI